MCLLCLQRYNNNLTLTRKAIFFCLSFPFPKETIHGCSNIYDRFTQFFSPVCESFSTCSSILYHPFPIPF